MNKFLHAKLLDAIVLVLSLVALFFFFHKIKSEWDNFRLSFLDILSTPHVIFSVLALLLINLLLESLRWKTLCSAFFPKGNVTLASSFRTVLAALAFGSSTPAGLGEHVARVNFHENKRLALYASFVASAIQTFSILTLGIIGFLSTEFFFSHNNIFLFTCFYFLLFIFIILIFKNKLLRIFSHLSSLLSIAPILLKVYLINILRISVFSCQLLMLLENSFFPSKIDYFFYAFIYYFIITFIPRLSFLDLGIKGSVAIYVFSNFFSIAEVSTAVTSLWIINILIPSFLGAFIILYEKTR